MCSVQQQSNNRLNIGQYSTIYEEKKGGFTMHMYLHWIACGKISIPYIIHEKKESHFHCTKTWFSTF